MRWRRSALFRPRSRPFYRTGLRYRVIYLAWRGLPLLAFAVLCFPALLAAAKPQATSSDSSEYDNQLDLRARKVFLEDAELARHNLGVTVRDSTVTIWGVVPSESLARRATEKLRQIPGVAEVRSDLRIEPPDDPIVEFLGLLKLRASHLLKTAVFPRFYDLRRNPPHLHEFLIPGDNTPDFVRNQDTVSR